MYRWQALNSLCWADCILTSNWISNTTEKKRYRTLRAVRIEKSWKSFGKELTNSIDLIASYSGSNTSGTGLAVKATSEQIQRQQSQQWEKSFICKPVNVAIKSEPRFVLWLINSLLTMVKRKSFTLLRWMNGYDKLMSRSLRWHRMQKVGRFRKWPGDQWNFKIWCRIQWRGHANCKKCACLHTSLPGRLLSSLWTVRYRIIWPVNEFEWLLV